MNYLNISGVHDFLSFTIKFCDLFVETCSWSRPKVNGRPPAARDGHTACVIDSRIYIFGGYEEEVRS